MDPCQCFCGSAAKWLHPKLENRRTSTRPDSPPLFKGPRLHALARCSLDRVDVRRALFSLAAWTKGRSRYPVGAERERLSAQERPLSFLAAVHPRSDRRAHGGAISRLAYFEPGHSCEVSVCGAVVALARVQAREYRLSSPLRHSAHKGCTTERLSPPPARARL